MIVKMLSQLVIATSLFNLFPADAGDVERLARLPVSVDVEAGLFLNGFTSPLPPAQSPEDAPTKTNPRSLGVVTSAVSAIIVDRKSKAVLFEKNVSVPRSIGSITKLMTAYVFLQSKPDLDEVVSIQPEDIRYGGIQHVSMYAPVRARDLLAASLISSDNTATAALVRLTGMMEGDFVSHMNETASSFGMKQTTFADSTGLSSNNQSVVYDVVLMLDRIAEEKEIRKLTQKLTATIVGQDERTFFLKSTDELLGTFVNRKPYKIVTAKTGFLPEAGYCLGSVFSKNDSNEIIVVVLGSETKAGRFQDVKGLATWAYKTFVW